MAVTALVIKNKDKSLRYLEIYTQASPDDGITVVFTDMDNTFTFRAGKDQGVDKRGEKEYHTELREAAVLKDQLLTSHSTNPEWTPEGYIKVLEIIPEEDGE